MTGVSRRGGTGSLPVMKLKMSIVSQFKMCS